MTSPLDHQPTQLPSTGKRPAMTAQDLTNILLAGIAILLLLGLILGRRV